MTFRARDLITRRRNNPHLEKNPEWQRLYPRESSSAAAVAADPKCPNNPKQQYWTCDHTPVKFAGCCIADPCHNNGICPDNDAVSSSTTTASATSIPPSQTETPSPSTTLSTNDSNTTRNPTSWFAIAPSPTPTPSSSNHVNTAVIIGSTIGGFAALLALGALWYLLRLRSREKAIQERRRKAGRPESVLSLKPSHSPAWAQQHPSTSPGWETSRGAPSPAISPAWPPSGRTPPGPSPGISPLGITGVGASVTTLGTGLGVAMEGWKSPHSQTVWKAHKLSPIPPSPPSSLSSFPGGAFAQSPYSTLGSDSRYGGVEERYVNDYGAYGGDGYDGYDTYSSRGGGGASGGGGRGMEYTGYDSYDGYTENHYGPATAAAAAAAAASESHYSLTTEDHSYHGGANLELYKSSGSIDSTTALTSSSSNGSKSAGLPGLATITTIDTSRGIYHPPTLQKLNTEEIQERAELPTAMYDPVELAGNKGETPTSPFYERRFYDVRYGTSRDGGAHDRWSAGSAEGIKRGR